MLSLINYQQYYDWGSPVLLPKMFGFDNPEKKPIAEVWMGANFKGSSEVIGLDKKKVRLFDLIEECKRELLSDKVTERFGELPFLFKVLCADKALSIQVHPSKQAAENGFKKENDAGIPLNSSKRNYKDSNHKPELIFALTPFRAMNGFRELTEIAELLTPVVNAHPSITNFITNPDIFNLKNVFISLLNIQGQLKDEAILLLKSILPSQHGVAWRTIEDLFKDYPDDIGLFMPLLLNVIELQPGEAMFLHAETPHAYFKGIGLEVMANSDNVLRAGLTSKHIDIPELISNTAFETVPYNMLRTEPFSKENTDYFPVPVEDFSFSIHHLVAEPVLINQNGPAIIFCIDGELNCCCGEQTIILAAGESVFIGANEQNISLCGKGRVARAYVDI